MHLRYVNKLGIPKDIELTNEPLSIGRAREADIPLLDDKVSRIHCGICLSDGEFYLKDLKSRNGTYVNGQRVEDTIKLKVGDRIQVGSTVFVLDTSPYEKDAADGIAAISSAMADGKGYTTILKEIVEDLPQPEAAAPAASPAVAPAPAPAAAPSGKPVIKIKHPAIKITTAPKAEEPPPPPPEEKSGGHGKIRIVIKK